MTSCDGTVQRSLSRLSLWPNNLMMTTIQQEKTSSLHHRNHHMGVINSVKSSSSSMNIRNMIVHPFSLYCIILIISIMMIQPSLSHEIPSPTRTTIITTPSNTIENTLLTTTTSIVPSNLFINLISTPQTSGKSSNSTFTFNVIPIAIGDKTDITCLECTLHAPVIYLMINDYGISFQYQLVTNNQCPSDFIKNFNQDNYSDPDAYLADRLSYSPQYSIGDLVNVTSSANQDLFTIYGVLYRNNEKMNSGVNCVNIKYSNNEIDTIAINLAANGSCPPISSSPSCKLSGDNLFIVEQFVFIKKK